MREDTCRRCHPYWTAENSAGSLHFQETRQFLTESINASQKAIEILNKAIAQKVAQK
ncbi:MAG: hypothetical protein ABSB32_12045 [Thermodesulfobacteriota bacterium]|jgi:hypothetical protein